MIGGYARHAVTQATGKAPPERQRAAARSSTRGRPKGPENGLLMDPHRGAHHAKLAVSAEGRPLRRRRNMGARAARMRILLFLDSDLQGISSVEDGHSG